MKTEPAKPGAMAGQEGGDTARLKIYLLPNLFTAANLFCGFLAITRIVEADLSNDGYIPVIKQALAYILLACVFDLLDGRVARMGGYESPFGREFDSLADIVSFGVAPAFLVHRIVLKDVFVEHPEICWFIASVYVMCGAFRLARFNCLAAMAGTGGGKYFVGFPIPAAAGLISSLTLFLLRWDEKGFRVGNWRYMLPGLLLLLSAMMVSEVKYPAFKQFGWKTQPRFTRMIVIILTLGMVVVLWRKLVPYAAPIGFTGYLIYGFVRPWVSAGWQRWIEQEDDEPEDRAGEERRS